MTTDCKNTPTVFHPLLLHRKVKARFDGGKIASDAGVLLLREVDQQPGQVNASLYQILQVLSVTLFEKMPILQAFKRTSQSEIPTPRSQLTLLDL